MSAWELPTSITVDRTVYAIRTDFRAVLDVLAAMNDPDLFLPDASDQEKAWVQIDTALQILIEDYNKLPTENFFDAYNQLIDFIDCGMKEDSNKPPVHLMDWEQDAQVIIPAINRVQGKEIRSLPYLHWWTFLGAYMEIGDCLFSQIINIRQKKQKHQKLEKWEQEFYRNNKAIIDLHRKLSMEEKTEKDAIEKWL
ncbi:Gp15 family bacteriophage protein [Blautia sp. MSJ-19]|uniref:Gp15 family bacteriophage protein n=1 Tax=Blautia sp. MSJ-19 TaxID=2841517 RepID=UPI001C0F2CC6|nr:Gp15 family bacteriophage protein [Blautia sp. MSJ-19]MBU5481739.1 bacteriophage Gp15 family protein [Blautia sp. MSJ-19]